MAAMAHANRSGLFVLLLSLAAFTAPRAEAALHRHSSSDGLDARLSRISQAWQQRHLPATGTNGEGVLLAGGFANCPRVAAVRGTVGGGFANAHGYYGGARGFVNGMGGYPGATFANAPIRGGFINW